jgi:hypothetical protein
VTSKYTFALKLAIRTPVTTVVRFIATEPTPHAATSTTSLADGGWQAVASCAGATSRITTVASEFLTATACASDDAMA